MAGKGPETINQIIWNLSSENMTQGHLNSLKEMQEVNGQNQLRFAYSHFMPCDQSLDKTSLNFSNTYSAMQRCAMSGKRSIILKLPKGMLTWLEMGKTTLS